jgi:hypothetical protein
MRGEGCRSDTARVKSSPSGQLVVIEADLDECVIRGVLTEPSGARREFHGWLELTAAIESALLRAKRVEDAQ